MKIPAPVKPMPSGEGVECMTNKDSKNMIFIRAKDMDGHSYINDLNTIMDIELKIFPKDAFSRNSYRNLMKNDNALIYMVMMDDKIVGHGTAMLTLLRNKKKKGRIYSIGVLKEYRRQGVAKRLLRVMEDWLIQNKAEYITLETHEHDSHVIKFYEKSGYVKTEDLPDYYEGANGIRMRKTFTV